MANVKVMMAGVNVMVHFKVILRAQVMMASVKFTMGIMQLKLPPPYGEYQGHGHFQGHKSVKVIIAHVVIVNDSVIMTSRVVVGAFGH